MQINMGIDSDHLKKSAQALEQILANEMVLYIKTLNFHWNVIGPHFGPLHLFFRGHYEKIGGWVDEIAERIRTLGQRSPGTMQEFLKLATLKEAEAKKHSAKEMLQQLLHDQEYIIAQLRKAVDQTAQPIHDMATSDFLTSLMAEHEQMAWMTRSHLEE